MIFFADLDECADNNSTCPSGYDCINTLGSYRCRFPCPDGFVRTLNETCVGNSCIFLFKQWNNYRYTDNFAYLIYGNVPQKFDNVTHNMIRALMVVFFVVYFLQMSMNVRSWCQRSPSKQTTLVGRAAKISQVFFDVPAKMAISCETTSVKVRKRRNVRYTKGRKTSISW